MIGAFGALAQKKIKRLLVYSSIGHVGYLLIGLCCGTVEGLHAVLLYLVIYVLMTVNIFAIVLASVDHSYTSRLKYIQDLGFLSQKHPILAVTLSATLFSMAGIPPLAGFCSKFYLFFAAMSSSLYGLAILGVNAKNAVTDVGAPSYTSGAQKWKGAAVSLNKKPILNKHIPICTAEC